MCKNRRKRRVFVHVDVLWTKMGILRYLAAILGRLGAVWGPRLLIKCAKNFRKTVVFVHVDVLWTKMGILRPLAAILGCLRPSWGRLRGEDCL